MLKSLCETVKWWAYNSVKIHELQEQMLLLQPTLI
jgi:hypothetical protein